MTSSLNNMELMVRSLERIRQLAQTDPELRAATAAPNELAHLRSKCRYSIEYVAEACSIYASRPFLGTLRGERPFATQSYAATWQRIQRLATTWQRSGQVRTGDCVGVFGFASPDWAIANLACLYLAAVCVPLQANLAVEDLAYIINETELICIVCSAEQLSLLKNALPLCPLVKKIVVMDDPAWQPDGQSEGPEYVNITVLEEQSAYGDLAPFVVPERDGRADPLLAIVYTSGSTGRPKGAVFPESAWVYMFQAPVNGLLPPAPYVCTCDLPLNHIGGITGFFNLMMNGGVFYFHHKTDMASLFEDIRAVRPTILSLVPRMLESVYQHYQTECIKRGDEAEVGDEVLKSMRHFLGDRLCYIVTSSAPTSATVLDFLKRCLQVPVLDFYGATESGTVTIDNRISGMVTAYKLLDLPELGYRTSDAPYPRGELYVKSPRLIAGYYKHPELTAQLFDSEGFLKTGDIVEERGPGVLAWIDRKNNVLKLAQGEYVSLSHLETSYICGSPFIEQIYLYGNSSRSYLLAVLVPNRAALRAGLTERVDDPAVVKHLIRQELERVAREAQIKSYEVPRDFLIEMQPFTKENGLLTDSGKLARIALRKRYEQRLEQLYSQGESSTLEQLRDLSRLRTLSISERVQKAVSTALGLDDFDISQGQRSFILLGGDSLSVMRLQALIQELCGVEPWAGLILDPNVSVQDLVQHVEKLVAGTPSNPSYAAVHGHQAQTVHASDLRLDNFLEQTSLQSARTLPIAPGPARTILLTGANGFLGRFLLLDLLERVAPHQGQIICLVRAHDDDAARARLRGAYSISGPDILARFDELTPPGRLLVLAGDLLKPNLGIGAEEYAALAKRVDTIVHNGALVNHALSYSQLFEPNVLGTVEVMRFAIQHQRKAINFISSMGMLAGLTQNVLEQEEAAQLWPSRVLAEGYAAGYSTSKWACEVLLNQLHQACEVPVNVFRCSMILGHSQLVGQVNPTDFFTRMVSGIVKTGLAPRSFYGDSGPQNFDGMPVDFVAGSISAIATEQRSGWHTYHVANPDKVNGASLDSVVDWLASAGCRIERISHFGDWFQRFHDALSVLPDQERSDESWLVVLRQWKDSLKGLAWDFDAAAFRRAMSDFTQWTHIPVLSELYVHHLLKSMAHQGLISSPDGHTQG